LVDPNLTEPSRAYASWTLNPDFLDQYVRAGINNIASINIESYPYLTKVNANLIES